MENHLDFSQAKVDKKNKIKIIARNYIHDLSEQLVIKIIARNRNCDFSTGFLIQIVARNL